MQAGKIGFLGYMIRLLQVAQAVEGHAALYGIARIHKLDHGVSNVLGVTLTELQNSGGCCPAQVTFLMAQVFD